MARQVYFGEWEGLEGKAQMEKDFAIEPLPEETEIMFALYHDPYGYSGEAFVIGREKGVLFFIEGAHCSCYGLEGQWSPDPTTAATLRHMNAQGTQFQYLSDDARAALSALIEELG